MAKNDRDQPVVPQDISGNQESIQQRDRPVDEYEEVICRVTGTGARAASQPAGPAQAEPHQSQRQATNYAPFQSSNDGSRRASSASTLNASAQEFSPSSQTFADPGAYSPSLLVTANRNLATSLQQRESYSPFNPQLSLLEQHRSRSGSLDQIPFFSGTCKHCKKYGHKAKFCPISKASREKSRLEKYGNQTPPEPLQASAVSSGVTSFEIPDKSLASVTKQFSQSTGHDPQRNPSFSGDDHHAGAGHDSSGHLPTQHGRATQQVDGDDQLHAAAEKVTGQSESKQECDIAVSSIESDNMVTPRPQKLDDQRSTSSTPSPAHVPVAPKIEKITKLDELSQQIQSAKSESQQRRADSMPPENTSSVKKAVDLSADTQSTGDTSTQMPVSRPVKRDTSPYNRAQSSKDSNDTDVKISGGRQSNDKKPPFSVLPSSDSLIAPTDKSDDAWVGSARGWLDEHKDGKPYSPTEKQFYFDQLKLILQSRGESTDDLEMVSGAELAIDAPSIDMNAIETLLEATSTVEVPNKDLDIANGADLLNGASAVITSDVKPASMSTQTPKKKPPKRPLKIPESLFAKLGRPVSPRSPKTPEETNTDAESQPLPTEAHSDLFGSTVKGKASKPVALTDAASVPIPQTKRKPSLMDVAKVREARKKTQEENEQESDPSSIPDPTPYLVRGPIVDQHERPENLAGTKLEDFLFRPMESSVESSLPEIDTPTRLRGSRNTKSVAAPLVPKATNSIQAESLLRQLETLPRKKISLLPNMSVRQRNPCRALSWILPVVFTILLALWLFRIIEHHESLSWFQGNTGYFHHSKDQLETSLHRAARMSIQLEENVPQAIHGSASLRLDPISSLACARFLKRQSDLFEHHYNQEQEIIQGIYNRLLPQVEKTVQLSRVSTQQVVVLHKMITSTAVNLEDIDKQLNHRIGEQVRGANLCIDVRVAPIKASTVIARNDGYAPNLKSLKKLKPWEHIPRSKSFENWGHSVSNASHEIRLALACLQQFFTELPSYLNSLPFGALRTGTNYFLSDTTMHSTPGPTQSVLPAFFSPLPPQDSTPTQISHYFTIMDQHASRSQRAYRELLRQLTALEADLVTLSEVWFHEAQLRVLDVLKQRDKGFSTARNML